jgi:hypothetical protein
MNQENFLIACVGAIVAACLASSLLMNATERQSVALAGGGLTLLLCLIVLKLSGWF